MVALEQLIVAARYSAVPAVGTFVPRAAGKGLQTTPSTWNGYLNMTGIDSLANLKRNT